LEMGSLSALAVSPDGETVAIGGRDGFVRFLDVRSGGLVRLLHSGTPVYDFSWSKNGRYLACAIAGDIIVCNVENEDSSFSLSWDSLSRFHPSMCFARKHDEIAAFENPSGVMLFNIGTHNTRSVISIRGQPYKIRQSPTSETLAVSFWDASTPGERCGGVHLHDLVDGKSQTIELYATWGIAFAADGSKVFAADARGNIVAIDVEYGKQLYTLDAGISGWIPSLQVCTSEKVLFAVQTGEGICRLHAFDLPSKQRVLTRSLPLCSPLLADLALCQKDSVLATASGDALLRLWDARPFVHPDRTDINLVDYVSPNLKSINENPCTWPEWWQNCRIKVPENMLPNPDFMKCIREIMQVTDCRKMCVVDAIGLDAKHSQLQNDGNVETLRDWFKQRGAITEIQEGDVRENYQSA
jgi:WD40 repeat protein